MESTSIYKKHFTFCCLPFTEELKTNRDTIVSPPFSNKIIH